MSDKKARIADLIPQAGSMILIDNVVSWDETEIVCATARHADTDNPLRRDGVLPAIAGAEIGAQAAAVHGGLTGRRADGYLVALRDIVASVDTLDGVAGVVFIKAICLARSDESIVYSFVLDIDRQFLSDRPLVSGRITVALKGVET